MVNFQVFVDGCVNGLTMADNEKEAAVDYAKEKFPVIEGFYYNVRDNGTVVVKHVNSDKYPTQTDDASYDPFIGRFMVVHAENALVS